MMKCVRAATLLVVGLVYGPLSLVAETFLVINTGDAGPGSLRQAILDANTSSDGLESRIEFQLSGPSPYRIQPLAALPDVQGPAVIDGFTQPGFSGRPLIELNGDLAGTADGLRLSGGFCRVQGLVINSFQEAGIRVLGGTNTIRGNFIGTDPTGKISLGNAEAGVDLFLGDGANIVGGPSSADRNVISGNRWGLYLLSPDNVVQGNIIGLDVDGQAPLGNVTGLSLVRALRTFIGGANPGEGNVISGNSANGIELLGSATDAPAQNDIRGNLIGLDSAGTAALGNGQNGIAILSGTNNSVTGNRIFGNGQLSLDLGANGITPNDDGDLDEGPNHLQNFPELTSSLLSGTLLQVQGVLRSRPNASFALELFASPSCDASGAGSGFLFLGRTNIITSAAGIADFSIGFDDNSVSAGWQLAATATDDSDNTSEFSNCLPLANELRTVPAFVLQPLDQSAAVGGTATFSAAISGEPGPFEYELRQGATPILTNRTSERLVFFTLNSVRTNDAGSYRILVRNAATAGPGVASQTALLTVLPDKDGDGIPDAWEIAHGLGTNNAADASLDADGDGMTNLQEYLADTDPTNRLSNLRLQITRDISGPAPVALLSFAAVSNKTYSVQFRDALTQGAWSNALQWVARASNTTAAVTNVISPGLNRFFRVVSPAQPSP